MYDRTYFNADDHLGLEQEFVSYHQSAEKLWMRNLEGAMGELPGMLWEDPEAPCFPMDSLQWEETKEAFNNLHLRNNKSGKKYL